MIKVIAVDDDDDDDNDDNDERGVGNLHEFKSDPPFDMSVPILQYAASSSSLAPSFPSASDVPSSHPTQPCPSPSDIGRVHRRSITLFSKFPKGLSSFIRTTTRQQGTSPQVDESRASKLVCKLLAKVEMQPQPTDIPAPESNTDERFARRLERKFYNFIRRSRSRSRSKPGRSQSVDNSSIPELPNPANEHGQMLIVGHAEMPLGTTVDDSKPPTRIQSRPLSSTTTATNATITPPTPTQNRHPRTLTPDQDPHPISLSQQNVPLRPSTSPSNPRKKFHDLFGSHASPHKEPSSPDMPGTSSDSNSLPRFFTIPDFLSNTHHHPASASTPPSSSVPSDITQTTSKSRSSGFSKFDFFRKPKFFSNAGLQKFSSTKRYVSSPTRHPPSRRHDSSSELYPVMSAPAAAPSPIIISKPDLPPHLQSTGNSKAIMSTHGHATSSSSSAARRASSSFKTLRSPSLPTRRTATANKLSQTYPMPTKSAQRGHHREASPRNLQGGYRSMAAISEGSDLREYDNERGRRGSREQGSSSPRLSSQKLFGSRDKQGKEKERREPRERIVLAITHNPERPQTAETDSHGNRRKNGSRAVIRNAGTAGNGRTKHGSFDFEKPGWGRGGTNVARSGYSQSGESLQSGTSNGRHVSPGMGSQEDDSMYSPTSARSTSTQRPSRPHTSSQTNSRSNCHVGSGSLLSPASQPSSGLSRGNSKRASRTPNTTATGISHGRFAFEPVVPSPATSELSESSASSHHNGVGEVKTIKAHQRKVGRRGQSLDLHLGLAWAPTKVKEEALIPFGRTISGESHSRKLNLVDRVGSTAGSDVTEAFRDVLSETSFAKFKKYVHQFDAHAIPFDGPSGIVDRIEKLLDDTPNLDLEEKRDLLGRFVRIILQNI